MKNVVLLGLILTIAVTTLACIGFIPYPPPPGCYYTDDGMKCLPQPTFVPYNPVPQKTPMYRGLCPNTTGFELCIY